MLTMDAERRIISPGALAIAGARILAVGPDAELRSRFDALESIDAEGGIVHPGFIDAHNHIVHTTCRGVFSNIFDVDAAAIKFADWKADVTAEDEAAATAMAAVEMLASGFTMFIEPGTLFSTHAAAEAVERVGMRALFSPPYLWDRRETLAAMPGLESDSLTARVVEAGIAEWANGSREHGSLIVRGRANLIDDVTALADLERIRQLFDALDERNDFIRLLESTEGAEGVQIFIGAESTLFASTGCSMVVAPYRDSEARFIGAIGVIGPTRINYGRIIPMVDHTAAVIGRVLG